MNPDAFAIDAAMRSEVVVGLLRHLRAYHVYPDVAEEIVRAIGRHMDDGDYETITDAAVLCDLLTVHVQESGYDKHLLVRYNAEPRPMGETANVFDDPGFLERMRLSDVVRNYGFERVERLRGNIGYLDLRGFAPLEWRGCGDTAAAAMTFLANTSALIIDVRNNGGGGAGMVDFLCSYLLPAVPEHTIHLIDFHYRDRLEQHRTFPHVPGPRYADKPVYVLTSERTISAGEAFAYILQGSKRATIVGETTAGAATLVGQYQINAHFFAFIPDGYVVVPSTGGNWQGHGVQPDLTVLREESIQVAHMAALNRVLETLDSTMDIARVARKEASKALVEIGQRAP